MNEFAAKRMKKTGNNTSMKRKEESFSRLYKKTLLFNLAKIYKIFVCDFEKQKFLKVISIKIL